MLPRYRRLVERLAISQGAELVISTRAEGGRLAQLRWPLQTKPWCRCQAAI